MAGKRSGLGKGLDSLIPNKVNTTAVTKGKDAAEKKADKPETMLPISKVEPNRDQPRKQFNEKALKELADSIRQYGVLQPLLVQKKDDYYEIIAGERRWRAAKLAGLKEVPVIIRNLTDQELLEISLIENIQREDLNPIEEALAYRRLLDEFHLKQEEVARRVSKSRTAVTNSVRLLKLTDSVQKMVTKGQLSTGHARCLISVEDTAVQKEFADRIVKEKWSVRETEKNVKRYLEGKKSKSGSRTPVVLDPVYESVQEQLKQVLGTKVSIQPKTEEKGRIEIEYYSKDELDRLLELMQGMR